MATFINIFVLLLIIGASLAVPVLKNKEENDLDTSEFFWGGWGAPWGGGWGGSPWGGYGGWGGGFGGPWGGGGLWG